jgi:hypothetical protein
MRRKSVWLHKPFGNPKKILFSVSKEEVTLGDQVFPAGEVVGCKRNFSKPFLKPINFVLTYGLLGWMFYEFLSVYIRLAWALRRVRLSLDTQSEADLARENERMQTLLQMFHLRASTTDDQQLQLFLWLYLSYISLWLFVSKFFGRRIALTLKNGDVVEAPFFITRPRKYVKTLKAGRKLSKRTRKSIKRDKKFPDLRQLAAKELIMSLELSPEASARLNDKQWRRSQSKWMLWIYLSWSFFGVVGFARLAIKTKDKVLKKYAYVFLGLMFAIFLLIGLDDSTTTQVDGETGSEFNNLENIGTTLLFVNFGLQIFFSFKANKIWLVFRAQNNNLTWTAENSGGRKLGQG